MTTRMTMERFVEKLRDYAEAWEDELRIMPLVNYTEASREGTRLHSWVKSKVSTCRDLLKWIDSPPSGWQEDSHD